MMKAEAIPLRALYSTTNKAYIIPDYQRPFAWSAERATDLLDAILEDSRKSELMTSIGTFLFSPIAFKGNFHPFGNNTFRSHAPEILWEVVDGQQRMTVLALLGFALQERLATLTNAGLQFTPPLEFDLMFGASRLTRGTRVPVIIRDEDNFDTGWKSDLALLLDGFLKKTAPTSSKQFSKVFEAIQGWVDLELDDSNFESFSRYLSENCQCIQVTADTQESAFMMFEPLNSTNEPLTALEVYRSRLIRKFRGLSVGTPNLDKTSRYIRSESINREEASRRADDLVFVSAQAYSGLRPPKGFLRLKKYLDKKVDAGFVERLEQGAEFLEQVWSEQSSPALNADVTAKDCIRFLKASKHTVVMPVLLRFFYTEPGQLPAVVRAFAAFFALWRSAYPTNKLPEVYRALLSSTGADDMSFESGKLKSCLDLKCYLRSKLEAKIGAPPAGSSIKDVWREKCQQEPLYEEQKTVCRFLILTHLGETLKSNLLPNDPWTKLDDIEHVLPANSAPRPRNLNAVGNLTFLPPAVNRSLGDTDWPRRREIYKLLSTTQQPGTPQHHYADGQPIESGIVDYLKSTSSSCLPYLDEFACKVIWGEKEIDDRSHSLLDACWDKLYRQWLS